MEIATESALNVIMYCVLLQTTDGIPSICHLKYCLQGCNAPFVYYEGRHY